MTIRITVEMANLDDKDGCGSTVSDAIKSDDIGAHRACQRTAVGFLREGYACSGFNFPTGIRRDRLSLPKIR